MFIPPDKFLPAVERSALMGPLTDWVLDRALAAASGWHRWVTGSASASTSPPATSSEADLPGRVLTALRRNEFPADKLTLEITETAAVVDSVMTGHVLHALRELGVELSVDDFGTGHSSLIRLAEFPIGEIKVDRSFVMSMDTAERPIVATAIQLARSLGLRVVAEGRRGSAHAGRPRRARLRPRPGLLHLAPAARGRVRRLAQPPGARLTTEGRRTRDGPRPSAELAYGVVVLITNVSALP